MLLEKGLFWIILILIGCSVIRPLTSISDGDAPPSVRIVLLDT